MLWGRRFGGFFVLGGSFTLVRAHVTPFAFSLFFNLLRGWHRIALVKRSFSPTTQDPAKNCRHGEMCVCVCVLCMDSGGLDVCVRMYESVSGFVVCFFVKN